MKVNTTTLLLGVSLAVVAGLFGTTIFGISGSNNSAQTSAVASGLITGHVVTTLTDSNGNIKEYRQSDNLIVNQGENCVTKMLFGALGGATLGTGVCTGLNSDGFRYIQIGNSSQTVASADYKLGNPYNATSNVPGLVPKVATVTLTNSSGNTAGTTAIALLTTTFTSTQTAAQTVSESGLFNSTADASNAMFARQTFTGISMSNGDSLTVQWTINVGGTASTLTP